MLDIGGDIGAAVITTPAVLKGEELEIRPSRGGWTGRHVAVLPRPLSPPSRDAPPNFAVMSSATCTAPGGELEAGRALGAEADQAERPPRPRSPP